LIAAHGRVVYLDTNVALWLAFGKLNRLSIDAKRALERFNILISPMVLVEVEFLYEIGKSSAYAQDIQIKLEHEVHARVCDFSFPAVAQVMIGEKWTRDPFDRMIVAHAKANGLAPLISADQLIQENYSRTIW
jgi:PIN domain nuclease of toxin-antitoxin system